VIGIRQQIYEKRRSNCCGGSGEFVQAFEPDGMTPEESIAFGITRKTLTQFYHSGWSLLETCPG
jgi:hypothetical protein